MSGSSQNDYSQEDIFHVAHSHWSRLRLNPMWRLPVNIQSVEPDITLHTHRVRENCAICGDTQN